MAGTCGCGGGLAVPVHLLTLPHQHAMQLSMSSPVQRIDPAVSTAISRRRFVGYAFLAMLLCIDLLATGLLGGSERLLAVLRTFVLPGLPFVEWQLWIGILCIGCALAAAGAWLRWGMDWLLLCVALVCLVLAALVMPMHHHTGQDSHAVHASHEFVVVLVVFSLLAQVRLIISRLPGTDWLYARLPELWSFAAVDLARAAAIDLLADPSKNDVLPKLRDQRFTQRARRVIRAARFRFGTDPLNYANAHLRAALMLADGLDKGQQQRLRQDAVSRLAGVPDSEPSWVRPLDGMLVALSLSRLDEASTQRWRYIWESRFSLRHGRRPAALHTPSMLCLGTAPAWEHAIAAGLACHCGWIDQADWVHLRGRCLGAAASSRNDAATQRLAAAGRLWAALAGDAQAAGILLRRTRFDDPLALAVLRLADKASANGQV